VVGGFWLCEIVRAGRCIESEGMLCSFNFALDGGSCQFLSLSFLGRHFVCVC
jgi:hypothetical protein